MIESSPNPVPLLGSPGLGREAPEELPGISPGPEELLGDPVIGDLVLARFDNTEDFYWAKVADISGDSRDVDWLRPLAGQPGSPLYACSNGCDDTQGRSGLRPEDVRFPMPEELASDSAPPVLSAEFMHSDIADEDISSFTRTQGTPTDLLPRHAVGWASKTQIRDDSCRVHQVKYRTCDSCHWHSWLCGLSLRQILQKTWRWRAGTG